MIGYPRVADKGWVDEELVDGHYRDTDISVIPELDTDQAENLIRTHLRSIRYTNPYEMASVAIVKERAHLQLMNGAYSTVVMDPSLTKDLPIAYAASPIPGPMLLLPSHMAPSVRALRAALLPGEPLPVHGPAPEVIIIASE